jgi:hypothetical protein
LNLDNSGDIMPISTSTIVSIASSDLARKILEPLASKLFSEVTGIAKDKWRRYTNSFERYLAEVENKHKYFSSQVFANEGQLLENYYIPLTLQKAGSAANTKKRIVVDAYPIDLIDVYKDVLIVDTAGMGKSTLLKFIFLRSLGFGRAIPIFIELRKISKEKNLQNFMLEELKLVNDDGNKRLLEQCLHEGIFTFFLDGFDEIPDDDKKFVSEQILQLKEASNSSRFILSSREEQSLSYLAEFHRFNIKPLSKEEAFDLIKKISPDAKIAHSLIEKVKAQPQESLSEFLVNPLLVSLLVKSFLHSPILPVRLSEFYRQVFDALFQTHDAKKELGGFSRRKRSGLDLDRFHKTLRALGVLSYQASKLEFSVDELLTQIDLAKVVTSDSSYSASSFRHDLLHAVPLFVQEGNSSRWAHRSLQEYFAAAFICIDAKEEQQNLLKQLYNSGVAKNANLLRLCADIDGKTFKHTLIKQYLTERIRKYERSYPNSKFPNIDSNYLEKRRSIIYDVAPQLIVFSRAMSLDKARDYVKKVSSEKNFVHLIPFSQDGNLLSADENVKYFVNMGLNKFSAMNAIISTYYHENIIDIGNFLRVKVNLKAIPHNTFLVYDDNPDNPINSDLCFKGATDILMSISLILAAVYNLEKMKSLYNNIKQGEKESSNLLIKFS